MDRSENYHAGIEVDIDGFWYTSSDAESMGASEGEDIDEDNVSNASGNERASCIVDEARVESFPAAGCPNSLNPLPGLPEGQNPWMPFKNAYDFKLARWFVESHTGRDQINEFFNSGMAAAGDTSFASAYGLRKQLAYMDKDMGFASWCTNEADYNTQKVPYYYRDPVHVAAFLIRQKCYNPYLVYVPVREFRSSGE